MSSGVRLCETHALQVPGAYLVQVAYLVPLAGIKGAFAGSQQVAWVSTMSVPSVRVMFWIKTSRIFYP